MLGAAAGAAPLLLAADIAEAAAATDIAEAIAVTDIAITDTAIAEAADDNLYCN